MLDASYGRRFSLARARQPNRAWVRRQAKMLTLERGAPRLRCGAPDRRGVITRSDKRILHSWWTRNLDASLPSGHVYTERSATEATLRSRQTTPAQQVDLLREGDDFSDTRRRLRTRWLRNEMAPKRLLARTVPKPVTEYGRDDAPMGGRRRQCV